MEGLIEPFLEEQKETYLCSIEYSKAFERVRHEETIILLTQLKIDGKDLQVIENMHWGHTTAMRVDGAAAHLKK